MSNESVGIMLLQYLLEASFIRGGYFRTSYGMLPFKSGSPTYTSAMRKLDDLEERMRRHAS